MHLALVELLAKHQSGVQADDWSPWHAKDDLITNPEQTKGAFTRHQLHADEGSQISLLIKIFHPDFIFNRLTILIHVPKTIESTYAKRAA